MRHLPLSTPRNQQGVVLFISLIVLVAMSLAGIALMRSVDTATLVAGNLAYKQASLQSSNRAVAVAANWLAANSAGTGLYNTNTGQGYFSSAPGIEPDWYANDTWDLGNPVSVNGGALDIAGNKVRYMIHRLCSEANTPENGSGPSGQPNQCARYMPLATGTAGASKSDQAVILYGNPELFYRVTIRVDGPRNTVTITQVNLLIPT